MMRTRIKICGITSLADALMAIECGADAIGLNFWNQSKRAVNIELARQICAELPVFVSVVALLVNADKHYVEQLVREVPISLLQFHGDEDPEFCQQFNKPYLKVLRMRPDIDVQYEFEKYSTANGILLDAYRKGVPGGTGESFEWGRIPDNLRGKITLAGGLTEHNISKAVKTLRPYAVDVSGGVEKSAGVKDRVKIRQFIRCVQEADRTEKS